VCLPEVVDREPDVVPHRVEGLVSEQLLDVVDVGVAPYHLYGAGAPESVGRHISAESRPSPRRNGSSS